MTTNQMWATLRAQRFSCSSVYLAVCFFSPYFFSFQMRMLWVMATKSLIKVYYICGPHLLHTDCHTVVEGSPCWLFLIIFLPITCLWMVFKRTCAMIFSGTKVKLAGLHTVKFPRLSFFHFLRSYCLCFSCCDTAIPTTMICQREQATHYEIT